jgi:CRISPR-associated protein Cas1
MSGAIYIDAHGTKVGHRSGRITLKNLAGEETTCPVELIERVIVCGHAHFSHDAIHALLRRGIPTVFCGGHGGYQGTLIGHQGHQVMRRMAQMDAARDPERSLVIARALIQAKMRGQRRLLKHWQAPGGHEIAHEILSASSAPSSAALRGHEGAAARAFFGGLRHHLSGTTFVFERRLHHPPPDPVNAALSLAYTLLLAEVQVGVTAAGMDPCIGFFHAISDGRAALLMDLIEPLRPLADRFIARLLRNVVSPGDFELHEVGCRMRDGRRGVFYREWETMLAEKLTWRGDNQSYQRLIHQQPMVLAAHLENPSAALHFWHLDAH